jgi:nicotinamidase-related amidase
MNALTEPHYPSAALLTIDVQRDTLDRQPLEVPGTSAAVPRISALCNAFRRAGRPIVHVVRIYRPDGSNAEPVRRDLVTGPTPVLHAGHPGHLLAPCVAPSDTTTLDDDLLLAGGLQSLGPDEVVMYKPRWGAFYDTALHTHLQARRVDTVVVVGCNYPNCPRTTIYQASERDYRIVLVHDAISGLYDRGVTEMQAIGVRLRSGADVIAAMEGARS